MLDELIVADLTVTIRICLRHNRLPELVLIFSISDSTCGSEATFELFHAYIAVPIDIKDAESFTQVVSLKQHLFLEGSCQKLSVIDLTIVVCVSLPHDLYDVWLFKFKDARHFLHILPKLIKRDVAVRVHVPLDKHIAQVS